MAKYFHIETLGCKVNQYDSQLIREQLQAEGYLEASPENIPPGAESVVVINTCTVTGRTDQKCRNIINRFVREKGNARICVTGCYVDGDIEALKKIGGIDILIKNDDKSGILKFLKNGAEKEERTTITSFEDRTRAFLKIQDGCNEFCSYCKVPYVRGRSRSKDLEAIVAEARGVLENGYKEIVLTGIHLGSYGFDLKNKPGLDEVVGSLSSIEGKFRIRISSIEPMNIEPSLIKKLSKNPKLCPHFHIPLQSGADAVLRRMGRRYSYADFKHIAEAVKENFANAAISTDIIAGFSGETYEQFKKSVRAVEEIGFSKVHIFPFSVRKGTRAASFTERVPAGEIKKRVEELTSASEEAAYAFRRGMVGCRSEVLVEETKRDNMAQGFTENYQRVKFCNSNAKKNSFVDVTLTRIEKDCFIGDVLIQM